MCGERGGGDSSLRALRWLWPLVRRWRVKFCVRLRSRFCLWCQIAFSWFVILSNRWVTAATAKVFVTINKVYPRVRYIIFGKAHPWPKTTRTNSPSSRRNPQRRKVLTRSKAKRTPKVRRSRLPSPSRTGRLKRSSRMGSPALINTPSPGAVSSIMLLRHSPCMPRPRRGRKT